MAARTSHPTHLRHLDVEQHDVGVLLAAGRQRGRSTRRLDHAVAAGDEHPADQRPDGG
jgi:hypothetical protein